jgi:hypothetical protein
MKQILPDSSKTISRVLWLLREQRQKIATAQLRQHTLQLRSMMQETKQNWQKGVAFWNFLTFVEKFSNIISCAEKRIQYI